MDAARRELSDARRKPEPIVLSRDSESDARLGIAPEFREEIERMSGPRADEGMTMPLGEDLLGESTRVVRLGLKRCVRTAVERNLAIQFARLGPAIGEAQVTAAEAAFDWVLFSNQQYNATDSPQQATFGTGANTNFASQLQTYSGDVGVRRTLTSGGRLTVQHRYSYTDNYSPGQSFRPNPAEQAEFTVQYDQPLLRGAGSEVTQAEIRLARNAERVSVQTLRRDTIRVVTETESTYWQLVRAQRDLMIFQRLLDRGITVRDQLQQRQILDANPAQIADARARVERRRSDVLRARTQLRLLSDRLKSLMNDPDLPPGSEVLVLPADVAVDQPVQFSLVESLSSAISYRPEVQQAILSIDDASIRQIVADNQRLPELALRLQASWASLDATGQAAYGSMFNQDFVDYVVGMVFEVPIGNRAGEAEYRRRRLERMQSVIAYRNTIQQVVGEVQSALEQVRLNYQLISQTTMNRKAAAESLRVLMVEKEKMQGMTVERLNIEFQRQEELAQAERDEAAAIADYNSSLAQLFAAMGTALERNGIRFVVPTAEDAAWPEGQRGNLP